MNVNLHVLPTVKPVSWTEFVATYPPHAVALDGFVADGPQYDRTGPRRNLNHHEKVDRLATRSTAQQVLINMQSEMIQAFTDQSGFHVEAFVNDCDQDVCLSYFLLTHPELVEGGVSPVLNRLVSVSGDLDATAGAMPYHREMKILRELEWVYDPYTRFRMSGRINARIPSEFEAVIDDCNYRIGLHLVGRGAEQDQDTRYNEVKNFGEWSMIEPIGSSANVGAFRDGIKAFATSQDIGDGRWRHSLLQSSIYGPFDLEAMFNHLNEVEGCTDDRWGGSDLSGGSPRVGGSALSPDELADEIQFVIAHQQTREPSPAPALQF